MGWGQEQDGGEPGGPGVKQGISPGEGGGDTVGGGCGEEAWGGTLWGVLRTGLEEGAAASGVGTGTWWRGWE